MLIHSSPFQLFTFTRNQKITPCFQHPGTDIKALAYLRHQFVHHMLGETASLDRLSYQVTLSPHDFQLSKLVPLSPPGLQSDPGPMKHGPLHAKPQQNCQEGADCSGIWKRL